jgi:hypothetical protein
VRARWLHLAGLILTLLVAWFLGPMLAPAVSAATLVAAIGLAGAFCSLPLRRLVRRADFVAPWWWDLLYFASIAAFLWAALVGDPDGMLVLGMPAVAVNVLLCAAVWVIEYRHPIRIYTTGRRYVFVR